MFVVIQTYKINNAPKVAILGAYSTYEKAIDFINKDMSVGAGKREEYRIIGMPIDSYCLAHCVIDANTI